MLGCPYGADDRPVNLAAAPMTHTAGLLSLPCTAQGGTVVVVTKPDPALMLAAIAQHRVTEFFLPPTVIYRLLDIPGIEQGRLLVAQVLAVRRGADVGGEAQAGHRALGPVMTGGYGQTEAPASDLQPAARCSISSTGKLAPDERLSSVGRPNPLVRVEIMNDANEILRAGRDRRDLRARRPGHEGLLQGSRTRPPRPSSTAGCTPATSATSTPRATCTSPTARRT